MGFFPESRPSLRAFRNSCNRLCPSRRGQLQLAVVALLTLPSFAQKAAAARKDHNCCAGERRPPSGQPAVAL